MKMNDFLEIIITFGETKYKAVCPAFPSCKGIGVTEKEALLKLSRSIARHINRSTRSLLENIILSDAYTEIIMDTTKNKKEHRRVFDFDLTSFGKSKEVSIKCKKMPDIMPKIDNDIQSLFNMMDEGAANLKHADTYPRQPSPGNHDEFLFGFPLNLN
ncbi:MAG: hypothetical protein GY730_06435 [bacterium]|nr:hypothetical protein [bacterium]